MEKKNDGGPAFPVPHSIDGNWVKEPVPEFCGMSLRDHFAGLAMQSLVGNGASLGSDEGLAKRAYSVADAMLKAREQ